MLAFLASTGQALLHTLARAGYGIVLLFRTLGALGDCFRRRDQIIHFMLNYGIKSLPVSLVVGVVMGMIMGLQTGIELLRLGQQESIGTLVAIVMCREMGPFITGLILTATVGSAMAAELATMAVSEELEALEVMSIDPVRYLVLPRFMALVLMCPIVTILVNLVGIAGGGVVGFFQLGVSWTVYYDRAIESLRDFDFLGGLPKDIYAGLLKSFVFGITISSVGLATGLIAKGGALGVGRAVREAVIHSFLLVIILSYILTRMLY